MLVKEEVLVINRKVLEEIGMFQGICLEVGKYLESIWSNHNAFFMNRSQAEVNSEYKQIIPNQNRNCSQMRFDNN